MNFVKSLQDELIKKLSINYKKYIYINISVIILIFIPSIYYGTYIKGAKSITSINFLDDTRDFFIKNSNLQSSDLQSQEMVIEYLNWIRSLKIQYTNSQEKLRILFQDLKSEFKIEKIVLSTKGNINTFTFYYDSNKTDQFTNKIYNTVDNFNIDIYNELSLSLNNKINKILINNKSELNLLSRDLIENLNFLLEENETVLNSQTEKLNKSLDSFLETEKAERSKLKNNFINDIQLVSRLLNMDTNDLTKQLDTNFDTIINYFVLGEKLSFNLDNFRKESSEYSKLYFEFNKLKDLSQNYVMVKSVKENIEIARENLYKYINSSNLSDIDDYFIGERLPGSGPKTYNNQRSSNYTQIYFEFSKLREYSRNYNLLNSLKEKMLHVLSISRNYDNVSQLNSKFDFITSSEYRKIFSKESKILFKFSKINDLAEKHIKLDSLKAQFEYIINVSRDLIIPLDNKSKIINSLVFSYFILPIAIYLVVLSILIFVMIASTAIKLRLK